MADAMNGSASPPPSKDMTIFVIGGEEYSVEPLSLYWLDEAREHILALSPDITFIEYAKHVIEILVIALREERPDLDKEKLFRACVGKEINALTRSMRELLDKSLGEVEPAGENPGTGTSELSSQTLPPPESSPEISGE